MTSRSIPYHNDIQRQQIWLAVTAIIICTQIQVANMTRKGTQQPKAQWNFDEIDTLLTYLILVKSMAGVTFKEATFNEAAQQIASKRTHGLPKIDCHCCHWDDEHGANINGPAAEAVWEEIVSKKSNIHLKPFKNSGWPFYLKMEQILPRHSSAQGNAAYNPTVLAPQDEPLVAGPSSATPDASASMLNTGVSGMMHSPIPSLLPVSPCQSRPDVNWGAPPPIPALASGSISVAPPILSAPLSSGSSMGKRSHTDMTHGNSAPPSTVWTSVSQMTKAESAKKQKLLTASGKTRPSAPKNDAVPEAANTAVLMNLQGSINYLLDSLNKGPFSLTDDARVAEHRSRAVKVIQSSADLLVDDKVLLMHVLMANPAACDTILDIDDLELCSAFVHSIVARAKQETVTL
ncbi:hypothetical protein BDR07DRAFT_1501396 [Suillus spraguei]|nr:hypothetical protein BDR07DRAFT_1501396 [Suillus spraguei]